MAYTIMVSTDAIAEYSRTLARTSEALRGVASKLSGIRLSQSDGAGVRVSSGWASSVVGCSVNANTVGQALGGYTRSLRTCAEYAAHLSDRVMSISGMFATLESSDSAPKDAGEGLNAKDVAIGGLLDMIGEFGFAGGLIAAILGGAKGGAENLITGGIKAIKPIAEWWKSNKNLNKIARAIGKNNADEIRLKRLLGLDKYIKTPSKAASWFGRFSSNFKADFIKGISSKATWAAGMISAAVSNFFEFKSGKISGDRAVVETVVEGAGTVALGVGLAAATGAALAAVGVAAPAVVVGGIVVVAGLGIDAAFRAITGSEEGLIEGIGRAVGEGYDWLKSLFAKKTKAHVVGMAPA